MEELLHKYTLGNVKLDFETNSLEIELFKDYLKAVREQIPWILEDQEALTTGAISYFGLILYSRTHGKCKDEAILNFILLYINLDYLLDSKFTSSEEKKSVIHECGKLLYILKNSPDKKIEITNIKIKKAFNNLLNLIDNGCSIETLEKCFLAEKDSLDFDKDEEELLEICIHKSETCINIIDELIGVKTNSRLLGACIQILDDLVDYIIDREHGNFTIVEHYIQTYGIVDELLYKYCHYLESMDNILFQVICMYGLIMYVSTSPFVSFELKKIFLKFNPFDYENEIERNLRITKTVNEILSNVDEKEF